MVWVKGMTLLFLKKIILVIKDSFFKNSLYIFEGFFWKEIDEKKYLVKNNFIIFRINLRIVL